MNFQTVLTGAANMVDDRRLMKRVRAELGRVSSHPEAFDVQVSNGAVTLRGPVLNNEVADILNGVELVRGVRTMHYELDGYDSAAGVPSLQERNAVYDRAVDDRPRRWAPAARAAVTAGLVATGAWAVMRARA